MDGGQAKLTVIGGANQGEEVELAGDPILLGRGADCDLVLHDNYASRHHCWVEPRAEEWWVRDLGSRNGTLVCGERVDFERRLYEADLITIGRTRIRFNDPAATRTYLAVDSELPGNLVVDISRRVVLVNEQVLDPPLSPKQWLLLRVLWEHRGQALGKEAIAAAVWPNAEGAIYDYQIDKLVSRLRSRLGDAGDQAIETVWGVGYRLKSR
jgi:pSer/pThr/pTyr-binding forkhead associated (FHA) protein